MLESTNHSFHNWQAAAVSPQLLQDSNVLVFETILIPK